MKRPWGVAIPALYFFLEEGARHLGVQQPVSRRMATSVSRRIMVQLLHRQALAARLQFLAYRVADLTSAPPLLARHVLRWPVLTWTVRSPEDRTRAAGYADQMIFEGFRP